MGVAFMVFTMLNTYKQYRTTAATDSFLHTEHSLMSPDSYAAQVRVGVGVNR